MDWTKLAPWNWFEDEDSIRDSSRAPRHRARRGDPKAARTDIECLFDDTFRRSFPWMPSLPALPSPTAAALRPSIDISEDGKVYTVRAELPGVEADDIALEVSGRRLVMRAEKRQESEEQQQGYHCVERSFGIVQRVLSLPEDADTQAIDARFRNGVLRVRIPKGAGGGSSDRSVPIQRE